MSIAILRLLNWGLTVLQSIQLINSVFEFEFEAASKLKSKSCNIDVYC